MKLHIRDSSPPPTTNPKLPIEPNVCKIPQETKMKFNWRANWEILLVLVIIVVGIVITTIAAIRSKDKHLLVLPEETDYGQLLAGGGSSSEQIASVPPLQQTDFQLQQQNALTNADDELVATTRRPPSPPPRTKTSPAGLRNSTGHLHHHHHHHNQLRLDHQHLSTNAGARARPDGKHNPQHLNHHHHLQQHSKHDDDGGDSSFVGPSGVDQKHPSQHLPFGGSTSASHDNYDALSTEPTPSQVRSEANSRPSDDDSRQPMHPTRHSAHGRQQNATTRQQHKDNLAPPETTADPLDEPVDGIADDFHTTRSSLANNRPNTYHRHHHQGNNSSQGSSTQASGVSIPAPLFDQPSSMSITPSLPMHGPYGVTPPTLLNTHHLNSNAQLQALLAQHASNNKLEPPILEQDDMMTSYSRMPSAGNLTEALIRDYNLASALGNSSSTLAANFFSTGSGTNSETGANSGSLDGSSGGGQLGSSSTSTRNRMHSAALPFSVLLNDLIKFTRPAAPTPNSSPTQQGTFEQPANSRPQHQSILQQLRSLPGPLLALLQGSSVPSGAVHESSSSSSSSGSSSSPPATSHDASESSPHYQRISMSPTEMHSILTRSLRSTGVLPAFPAPKDVPDSWIPPTSGGNPAVHDAMNSNADFVASNVAGFVRASGQQQQASSGSSSSSASGGGGGSAHQASEQNQYHQPAQADSTNLHHQQDGNIGAASQQQQQQQQQIPNQSQGHFISIEQHQRLQAQQSYGQQHQPMIQVQASDNNNNIRQDYQQMQHQSPQMTQQVGQMHNGAQMRGVNAPAPQMIMMNQRPVYNSRPVSEIPVPLGHNPSMLMQQQPQLQQQSFAQVPQPQPIRRALEFAIPVESAPKPSITSSVVSSVSNNKPMQQVGGKSAGQAVPSQPNSLNRQKREALTSSASSSSPSSSSAVGEIEMAASRDNPSEEEEFLDSRPVSIVRPDGRPMSGDIQLGGRIAGASKGARGYTNLEHQSGRAGEVDLSSPSQRKVNHMDFDALNYYASSYKRQNNNNNNKLKLRNNNNYNHSPYGKNNKIAKKKKVMMADHKKSKLGGRFDTKSHSSLALDAAGSGLMSKLLGTASTNDDVEEDMDADDEDSANERRKEELEDAEFGLVNDDRNSLQQPEGSPPPPPTSTTSTANSGADGNEISRTNNNNNDEAGPNDSSHLGSGSTDSEAYARRNQQRSDIEFYGHPGEETRTLKYGILGSGNYEVVNGGIYPEADESTAAVNSVANYVRKPGLLVAGLPKLMGHHSQHHQQAAAAFMPGGRIGVVGGYMRDASATPEDLLGHLMPTVDGNKALTSPLLDLIDANGGGGGGHLFDPNLVAHLGSSGTSARTTHTSQESGDGEDASLTNGKKPGKRKYHQSLNHQQQQQHQQTDSSLDGNNNEVKKPLDAQVDDENDAAAGIKSTFRKGKKSSKGKLKKFKTSMNEQQQYVAEFNDPNTNEQDTRSSSIDSNRQALNNDYNDDNNNNNNNNSHEDNINHHHHHHHHHHHNDNDDHHRHESKSRDDDYRSSSPDPQARKQAAAANPSGSYKSAQGTNQFNSYQILPSKKVTIFSDQDLDSAPSNSVEATYLTR